MEQEAWEPTEPGDLKIGDYIRIDHRWFDHPFERRFFRISTDKELGIIRDRQLTRVFVDRARAEEGAGGVATAAQAAPATDAAAGTAPAEGTAPTGGVEPPETLVIIDPAAEAAREAKFRAEQRTALEGAKARDRHTRERALQTLSMLSAGNQDSAVAVAGFVDFLVAILNNSTSPLAPMSSTAPRHSTVRLALLGSDAVWLAGLIGKRMGLSKPELRALTHAALVHAVGLTRMPPNLPEEEPGVTVRGTPLADYPTYSALILEGCGGFDAEVLRIVSEHRERPDGNGLPKALQGDRIHPHALIIGAVRELQIRCAGNAVAPGVALAGMYKSLRESHGTVIANHLASAVLLIPVGTYVQLSDGSVARVQKLNEAARLSPVVESFGPNAELRAGKAIDLSQRPDLFIVRALDTSKLPPKMFDTVRDMGANTAPPEPAKDSPTVEAPPADAAVAEPAAAVPDQASGA
ncbi:MAG: HD domain-containing phosphohydrolase [Pseudomonadota bacterium]